jgi:indole-3-glycerol phosphate synthase
MATDLLAAIVASSRKSADERARSGEDSVARTAAGRTPRGAAFLASLRAPGTRVIAECKRRSPSRGVLRAFYDPAAVASGYAEAGAAAISVLTEPSFFDGSLEHLRAVRASLDQAASETARAVPLLCKDFLVTEFQLLEARAAGADAVLLIVAALDEATLRHLMAVASRLGLASLVEVHDRPDLDRALAAGAPLIGVNSRDLRTLEVHPDVFESLAPHLPAGVTAVAESGLTSPADLTTLQQRGYRAFLIGERFMVEHDPGAGLRAFLARGAAGVGSR